MLFSLLLYSYLGEPGFEFRGACHCHIYWHAAVNLFRCYITSVVVIMSLNILISNSYKLLLIMQIIVAVHVGLHWEVKLHNGRGGIQLKLLHPEEMTQFILLRLFLQNVFLHRTARGLIGGIFLYDFPRKILYTFLGFHMRARSLNVITLTVSITLLDRLCFVTFAWRTFS